MSCTTTCNTNISSLRVEVVYVKAQVTVQLDYEGKSKKADEAHLINTNAFNSTALN